MNAPDLKLATPPLAERAAGVSRHRQLLVLLGDPAVLPPPPPLQEEATEVRGKRSAKEKGEP